MKEREITIRIKKCSQCPFVDRKKGKCKKNGAKIKLRGKITICPFPEIEKRPGEIPNLLKGRPFRVTFFK